MPQITAQSPPHFRQLLRAPYLQCGSASSMFIRWRTAQRTESVVRYGLSPDQLGSQATVTGLSHDHSVRISGLEPGTKYFYGVGTFRQIWQSGPENYFVTSPRADSTNGFRVWVLGDPGTDYPTQKAVRDAYLRQAKTKQAALILTLGDNAYSRGSDGQYEKGFFEVYRDLLKHTVVWPSLGNHDTRTANSAFESGPYYEIFALPRAGEAGGVSSLTGAYYSFDYGNVHFICLNSADSDRSESGLMMDWLRRDLQAKRKTWTVAYWHHPPYSKGSHDSDVTEPDDAAMTEMRETFLPVLEKGGIDLILCGHSHLYERSYLLEGHYGKSPSLRPDMIRDRGDGRSEGSGPYDLSSGGTIYVNAGSAGHATKKSKLHGLNHPAMAVSLNVPGSFVLDIDGPQLNGTFLDDRGRRRDWFTLRKGR